MAQRGGQPGNNNASHDKPFKAALERAIAQNDAKKLRDAAEKLLDAAALGESWAVKELRDTLDGRPAQTVQNEHSGDVRITHAVE